jgi:hypothetical protein
MVDGEVDLQEFLAAHKARIRKLSNKRLYTPRGEPYMEGHNTWIANHEGSTLVIPIGDLAQHVLSTICFYTINQFPIYDDIAKKQIPGIDKYENLVDTKNPIPLTFLEQYCISELTAEEATEAVIRRKFGDGGVYNTETPGAWKDSYGKFPATVPSIFLLTYRQAQHIDLDFYDHYFKPGAYLSTHTNHMRKWHGE